MSTMGTTTRCDEIEAQRRYPTPALFVRRPAGVEDGAEEIELGGDGLDKPEALGDKAG